MENYNIEPSKNNEEPSLDYYIKMRNKLNTESENIDFIMHNMPPTHSGIDTYIKEYTKNLSTEELHTRAKGLIKAQNLTQNDHMLEHMSQKNIGNFNHFRAQWSPIIWQSHERNDTQKIKIGDKVVNVCDLNYSIANSLEIRDAHRDPLTEYYDWVKIQAQFENDINSDGTTLQEIENRNNFISFMDMRETEIKHIALLYSGTALNANSPLQALAQEKLKFTLFKLSELRRLRDKMKATKSSPDKPKPRIEEDTHSPQKDSNPFGLGLLLSIAGERLNNMLKNLSLDNNIVDNYTKDEQENSFDETTQKIMTLMNNSENMHAILVAMRNGMSKEEWLEHRKEIIKKQKEKRKEKEANSQQPQISGFSLARYNQALKELNA